MAEEKKAEQKEKEKPVHVQVVETAASLIIAAFGLIAALAWNTAISTLVNQYLSGGSAVVAQFIYAILVTILAVVVIIYIGRVLSKYRKMGYK